MAASRGFLYSALVTLVFYVVLAANLPSPTVVTGEDHQYALAPTGTVKIDFLDFLPAGEPLRVTVNTTRGGPLDVYLVQMNETYDALFERGALNESVVIPGLDAYSALEVRNYTFEFRSDGAFQYAVFLDNRRYGDPDADPLDAANATLVVVRTRFAEERERAAVLVGLLTTLPAVLLPTYALVRRVRRWRDAEDGAADR